MEKIKVFTGVLEDNTDARNLDVKVNAFLKEVQVVDVEVFQRVESASNWNWGNKVRCFITYKVIYKVAIP